MNLPSSLLAMVMGAAILLPTHSHAESVRLKDLGKLSGWRENALVGYGVVVGLAGTGDSATSRATRQSISNLLSQFDLVVPVDQIQSRNVAAVTLSASVPPFSRPGDRIDLAVASIGDAKSLVGGTLLLAPLKGANSKIYALAQGPLSVGGYRYDANGNVQQKNHPTVGSIPGGATIEAALPETVLGDNGVLTFLLNEPDYVTAERVAAAINASFGGEVAGVRDGAAISIAGAHPRSLPLSTLISKIESLSVEPEVRARVVINERTGTVVAGANAKISRVSISHADIRVSVATEVEASQPLAIGNSGNGIRTEVIVNTRMNVAERDEAAFVRSNGDTVADLVQALTKIKASTRDIISILRAVKAAGALHAEIVVQ